MKFSTISLTTTLISSMFLPSCASLETRLPPEKLIKMHDTSNYIEEYSIGFSCGDEDKQEIIVKSYKYPETDEKAVSTATRKGKRHPFMILYPDKKKPVEMDDGFGRNKIPEDNYFDRNLFLKKSDALTIFQSEICRHMPKTYVGTVFL